MGPGGRGGGRAGRRRRHRARRHVAADDGAARSVGEHAAHHAGRVLRGGRWRRHGVGAPVRRGHPRTGSPARPASFTRRIARNTQLLLLEESHIGRVLDPAGGSWFVEDLTEQLAEQAWKHFQDIESRGGFVEARESTSRPAIAGVRPIAGPTTSRTGAPGAHRCQRVPRSCGTASAASRFAHHRSRATRPGSRRCGIAPTPTSRRPGRGRRCCCFHSARSPSTTSVRRSPPTCWPPAGSRRSTRAPSTPPVSRKWFRCRHPQTSR